MPSTVETTARPAGARRFFFGSLAHLRDHFLFCLSADICTLTSATLSQVASANFSVLVGMNCSSFTVSDLCVDKDLQSHGNCSVSSPSDEVQPSTNSRVNITCVDIQNNAGRPWSFDLRSLRPSTFILVNATLTIILRPLSLDESLRVRTNISDDDPTSISFLIDECQAMADDKDLFYTCSSASSLTNWSRLVNCRALCSDLVPGQWDSFTVLRSRVPTTTGQPIDGSFFAAENKSIPYQTSERTSKLVCACSFTDFCPFRKISIA